VNIVLLSLRRQLENVCELKKIYSFLTMALVMFERSASLPDPCNAFIPSPVTINKGQFVLSSALETGGVRENYLASARN
jgi:hypothetical protein